MFHAETQSHIDDMLSRIHARGVRACVALKPATSLSALEYVLSKCDAVLLMPINSGNAFVKSEKQVDYAGQKILALREMIERRRLDQKIELDSRVSLKNIKDWGSGAAM